MDRFYELQGRAHSALARIGKEQRGQGTVEYVGVILLIAAILGVAVKFGGDKNPAIAKAILKSLTEAIMDIKK